MPAQYPAINDAEYDLLKKLVQNTYLIVNGGGGGGGGVWGAITGTLSNQTDLQSALNAKANTFTADNGLTLTGSSLNVDAAQTTISSITSPAGLTLGTTAGADINLAPDTTGKVRIPAAGALFPGVNCGIIYNNDGGTDGIALVNANLRLGWLYYNSMGGLFTTGGASDWSLGIDIRPVTQLWLKDAAGAIHVGAAAGVSGTITAASTVTVVRGIITNIA